MRWAEYYGAQRESDCVSLGCCHRLYSIRAMTTGCHSNNIAASRVTLTGAGVGAADRIPKYHIEGGKSQFIWGGAMLE